METTKLETACDKCGEVVGNDGKKFHFYIIRAIKDDYDKSPVRISEVIKLA